MVIIEIEDDLYERVIDRLIAAPRKYDGQINSIDVVLPGPYTEKLIKHPDKLIWSLIFESEKEAFFWVLKV